MQLFSDNDHRMFFILLRVICSKFNSEDNF